MATWADVRALALRLPEVDEVSTYRMPALRVRGRLFANMSPHEPGALVLHVDPDERQPMLESRPDLFYATPHYRPHPLVLVRLEAIDLEELRERLTDSWLLRAPKRLLSSLDANLNQAGDRAS